MVKKIAVFLDRDGTINQEVGYVNHEDRFKILPGVARAIKLLNDKNVLAIICTNQAGVARGYFKETLIKKVHNKLINLLKQKNAFIDDIYYCPHHPNLGTPAYKKDCSCRKPKIGMLEKAVKKHNVDITHSYVVWDKISDIIWAHKAGVKAILVLTGYGKGEYIYQSKQWKDKPEYIAKNLYDAVRWILKTEKI